MKRGMHWRLMAAFAAFTLGVTLLFGLFAMAFVYTVEDHFLEKLVKDEAVRQQQHYAKSGQWQEPQSQFIKLHTDTKTLPDDVAEQLSLEPKRKEFFGADGRHYHVLGLVVRGKPPLLVAEVSQLLIVRPMRTQLLSWLAALGASMVAMALALAWWLARLTSAPLEQLAAQVAQADPADLPAEVTGIDRRDEIGTVARGLDTLINRTRNFIEREQSFTRDVSHELRTPLAVMRMSLERLLIDTNLPSEARSQIGTARAAVLMMEQTANTLLLLANEDIPATQGEVAILPLIEKWVLVHESWLDEQQLSLSLNIDARDCIALPAPVAQLLLANLLGNAVAHGRNNTHNTGDGKIRVSVDAGALSITNHSAELPLGLSNALNAGDTHIKGAASAGFGLGLSIVRRLLERYHGTLTINHYDGVTVVRVLLPTNNDKTDL